MATLPLAGKTIGLALEFEETIRFQDTQMGISRETGQPLL